MGPRVKILVAGGFSVILAVSTKPPVLLMGALFAFLLIILAELGIQEVFYRFLVINTFVAFLWIFLPFTFPGTPLFTIDGLSISRQGITTCLEITVKSNAIVLVSMALLSTSTVFGLVHFFFFSFRYIHVIHTEYHKITNAMKARGFEPGYLQPLRRREETRLSRNDLCDGP